MELTFCWQEDGWDEDIQPSVNCACLEETKAGKNRNGPGFQWERLTKDAAWKRQRNRSRKWAAGGGSIAGMENSVCGMFRWRQAWHPRHSKKEKDVGAVGPRGFSSQERRPSHISLSGQWQGELKILSYTKLRERCTSRKHKRTYVASLSLTMDMMCLAVKFLPWFPWNNGLSLRIKSQLNLSFPSCFWSVCL